MASISTESATRLRNIETDPRWFGFDNPAHLAAMCGSSLNGSVHRTEFGMGSLRH